MVGPHRYRIIKESSSPTAAPVLVVPTPPEQNPLQNDVILDALFQYFPINKLLPLRLVCKQWYTVSLPLLLKNGPPIPLHNEVCPEFIACLECDSEFSHARPMPMVLFLKDIHTQPVPPFVTGLEEYKKFNLHGWKRANSEYLNKFWSRCGRWITQLQLRDFAFPNVDLFKDVIMCRYTPVLESLDVVVEISIDKDLFKMTVVETIEGENTTLRSLKIAKSGPPFAVFPISWSAIFRYFKNLQHFVLGSPVFGVISELDPILTAIGKIRNEDMNKMSLKTLSWFDEHYNQVFKDERTFQPGDSQIKFPLVLPKLLRSANLKLESLGILFPHDLPESVVSDVIKSQGANLKTLGFYRTTPLHRFPFNLLANLQHLVMRGHPVTNVLFLKLLPHLRSLKLWTSTYSSYPEQTIITLTNQEDMQGVKLSSLTHFSCNYRRQWSITDISRLRAWMPNLTHLEMGLENETFKSVCELWPDLEHLCVYGYVGDKEIAGVVKCLRQSVCTKPNLTNLQNLRSFKIDCLSGWLTLERDNFTTVSIYQGFLMLPLLERLVIKSSKISREVRHVLEKEIPFVNITIQDENSPSGRRMTEPEMETAEWYVRV